MRIFFGDVIFTFFKFLVLFDHLIYFIFWRRLLTKINMFMLIVMFFAFEGGIGDVTIVDVV